MRLRAAALLLALFTQAFGSEESCMGRCENGFDSQRSCQCDSMCKYYKSCCSDFEVTCGMTTRGDTFVFAEDDDEGPTQAPELSAFDQSSFTRQRGQTQRPTNRPVSDFRPRQHPETVLEMTRPPRLRDTILERIPVTEEPPISQTSHEIPNTNKPPETEAEAETTTVPVTTVPVTTVPVTNATTAAPDPDAEVCSERPFDSFMQMKNGSIYAFRGDYFFELDQKSVLPGYPKLIKDVWGISGPIDAAFTRMNCQGKTYIFKGNKYWRYDDGVLDDDYPRDISVGFDKIPDHVDAAFALPAPGHNGKEKVYFFKGDQYYTYEFLHQPSHEECISMSLRSPATRFRHYTDVYYNNYERFFSQLFGELPQHHDKHHFIDKDWKGLKSPLDAAMAGRIYVSPWRPSRGRNDYQQQYQQYQQYGQQWDQQYGQQSIAKYWLGCSSPPGAEK
ncbi:vitronectin a [Xyrichtys novacula]|uniref:Vitronectin a n=1 Tax=Xyrichtys novacula TaxID=13765 RepID=A0AAV1FXR1_XYRNO|nr:vitronectin a [Xyrichtys novacula]